MARRNRPRRKIVRVTATALALITLVVVAYLVVRRWSVRFKPQAQPQQNPSSQLAVAAPMLRFENGLLTIGDYNAWFEVLPRVIRRALRQGHRDAESILVDVFSSILPEQQWPPPSGSPHRWQWQQMVDRTAALIDFEPKPRPTRGTGLRVVAPSAHP